MHTSKMIGRTNNTDNNAPSTNVQIDSGRTPNHVLPTNEINSTEQSVPKSRIKEKRVPSFLQKLNPFASAENPKKSRIITSGNVQTLKQFWIDAFGGTNKYEKSVNNSKCLRQAKEKCATLSTLSIDSIDTTDKVAVKCELNKNIVCNKEIENQINPDNIDADSTVLRKSNSKKKDRSKSLDYQSLPSNINSIKNDRCSDNFYKFKTASTVNNINSETSRKRFGICPSIQIDATGKLQWARRTDIIVNNNKYTKTKNHQNNNNNNVNNVPTAMAAASVQTIISEINNTMITKKETVSVVSNRMSHTTNTFASDKATETAAATITNVGAEHERKTDVQRQHLATTVAVGNGSVAKTINIMTIDKNVPDMADFIEMPQHTITDNDNIRDSNCEIISACSKQMPNDAVDAVTFRAGHNTNILTAKATATTTAINEMKNSVVAGAGADCNGTDGGGGGCELIASSSPRKLGRTTSGTRKYSFKTNTANFQRHSKKMVLTSTANFGSIGQSPGTIVAGKVALLANRFNQLIIQEKLKSTDVKSENNKKTIILHRTAGHIYKIREESDGAKKKVTKKTDSIESPGGSSKSGKKNVSVKRKGSVKTVRNNNNNNASNNSNNNVNNDNISNISNINPTTTDNVNIVRATIHQFEPNKKTEESGNVNIMSDTMHRPTTKTTDNKPLPLAINSQIVKSINKPVVPAKSAQVLLRTKEIAIRNNLRNSSHGRSHVSSSASNNERRSDSMEKEVLRSIGEEELIENKIDISNKSNGISSSLSSVTVSCDIAATATENLTNSNHNNHMIPQYAKILPRPSQLFPVAKKPSQIEQQQQQQVPDEMHISEEKIVEAINSVNQRIAALSKTKSVNCLSDNGTGHNDRDYQQLKMDIKPNVSFLFRPNSQDTFGSQGSLTQNASSLVEAVNNVCILKAQSMYDIRTRRSDIPTMVSEAVIDQQDDMAYEVIKPRGNVCNTTDDNITTLDPVELHDDLSSSGIYQSICEIKTKHKPATDTDSINSYESFENYETVDDDDLVDKHATVNVAPQTKPSHDFENGYEICDPPTPPPPRRKPGNHDQLNNGDRQQPPPLPPNFLNKNMEIMDKLNNTIGNGKPVVNYESVKYTKIPPRPPKNHHMTTIGTIDDAPPVSPLVITTKLIETNYDADDYFTNEIGENIYDTIKHREEDDDDASSPINGAGCYESIQSVSKPDFMRMTVGQLKHSDSITTLSSDHKTNSLYGTSSLSQNITPPSEKSLGALSDNSDEWIDISDTEEYKGHKFVVIRKRNHRSPDWNRKVREQRMQQQHNDDNLYDDSDHYYETLNQNGHSGENNIVVKAKAQPQLVTDAKQSRDHITMDPNEIHDDEYDSFDSDDDTEDENIKKNDSGVDVSLSRLPDPPTPTNQVYAIMQKINKNFGSLSKSLSKLTKIKTPLPGVVKHSDAVSKTYENTQFYVSHNGNGTTSSQAITEEMPSDTQKTKTKKLKGPRIPKVDTTNYPYENTEFHSPHVAKFSPSKSPLPATPATDEKPGENKKNRKSGSSFRYHFRRSSGADPNVNLGSSFNGKRSTFYVSNGIDADSGVFTGPCDSNGNGQNGMDANADESGQNLNRLSNDMGSKINGSRPHIPPPPPPPDRKGSNAKRAGPSSWYAECGVFKANSMPNGDGTKYSNKTVRNGNAGSWYAEAGLYQTSGASVASSSGSSGVSTGGEGCTGDDNSHSMFLNEPLYQIYSAAKLESINQDIEADNHEHVDGYERVIENTQQPEEKKVARPSALQLVGPRQGPSRTLWCEIPEVINSEILSTLTPTEKRLQEAKFEILTSEASYLKSLTLLRTHFMNHPAFRDVNVLGAADRKTLFSFIVSVQECSDRLLCDLENCWQDNIMLLGLSQSVYNHAEKYFHVYVNYCEHQGKLDRTLKRLKETKTSSFYQTLEVLEKNPLCCGLSLYSFLMLPMQRITRLPLLVDAVLSKLKTNDDEFDNWKMTLALLNKIVTQCNEAAKRSEQVYEMELLSRKIEFPSTIRPLAILPVGVKPTPSTKPRALIKRGEMTHLVWRGEDGKLTFGKKFSKVAIYVFLFTDLVVLTKKRHDDTFIVLDYCNRSLLNISSEDIISSLTVKDKTSAGKHLLFMTLLENHENKTIEMIVDCPSETERQRWLQATEPISSENPEEKLYEQWDCPQVLAKHTYIGLQPDELALDPGDIVNVSRKMADGWYHGERIRDGAQGWFPGNYTEEVESAHVRARNLKQRHRLLTISAAYCESQKKK